ncbi:MAG TPA: hypothetical protein VFK47_17405 [Ktedonobacteraceae bacterium]|nr:hypothetical protein [Ktedonobacteraceae bacterium]
MNGEAPLVVNLEITVPRIVLSATEQQDNSAETASGGQSETGKEAEQVRLSPAGFAQPQIIVSAGTERIVHSIKFSLFRLKLLEVSKPLILQILRRSDEERSPGKQRVAHERFSVADTSAFKLEFRRHRDVADSMTAGAAGNTHEEPLQAGLNQVVIYLDNEDMPVSYRIDGAES